MKKIVLNLSALLLTVSVFFSCENVVGLGEQLNLDPPKVTILEPDFMENVSEGFTIAGTASDKKEISILTVKIEKTSKNGIAWNQEWISRKGIWRTRSNFKPEWVTVTEDVIWDAENGKNNISWFINISMQGADDGDYLISAGAENNVGNKGPFEERRVVVDKEPPIVSLLSPSAELSSNYNDIFNGYELKNPVILDKLHNEKILLQYEVHDDFSLASLLFKLTDAQDETKVFYETPGGCVENLGWSGRTVIYADEIRHPDTGKPVTEKTALKIISFVKDRADNEKTERHGRVVWWPDADIPWVVSIGHETTALESPVYPESNLQLLAYDDDGVKWVSYKVYKLEDGQRGDIVPGLNVIRENVPLIEGSAPSRFFSVDFDAPADSSEYELELECEDINGIKAEFKRLFFVMDVSAPSVEVISPSRNQSLFGDTGGNFNISGTAYDGTDPRKLTLVWIHPERSEDLFNFLDPDDPNWNASSLSNGNKIWDIPLNNTASYNPDKKRYQRNFSYTLNLFNDFDIGNVPLTTQTFILRVESSSGRAVTQMHSVMGDISPPHLAISSIIVESGGEIKTYTVTQLNEPEAKMESLKVGDKITIYGTWSDNSQNYWNPSPVRMGALNVTWNGIALSNPTLNTGGTWEAVLSGLPSAEASKGGARIDASLLDYGRNMGKTNFNAKIAIVINDPFLQSFGGSNPGTYKTGETIEIRLNLNSAYGHGLEVTAGSPSLILNFKTPAATAIYDRIHANSLVFKYTIVHGDDVDVLEIADINLSSAIIKTNDNSSLNEQLMSDFETMKLNGQKLSSYTSINIKTLNPVLESFSFNNTAQTLTLEFDEEVYKGTGNIVLEQPSAAYLVPAVLSKSEFLLYGGTAALGSYYTVGTNGTDSYGVSDLTEKYILNYSLDTNNSAIVAAMVQAGANKVIIDIASSAVSVASNRKSMTINLNSGFTLPVKGVSYKVTLPKTAVQNVYSNHLGNSGTGTGIASAADNVSFDIANPGVNKPVIRVQKQKETISNTANNVPVPNYRPIYRWVQTDGEVSITTPDPATGWVNLGAFSIGPTFTAYIQDASPDTSYFNLKDFVHREATGVTAATATGQFQTNIGVWHNSGTNQLSAGWNNPGGNDWTQIVTGNSDPTGAIVGIQNYSTNIWVSLKDNTGNYEGGANYGRGGIVIYNLWTKGVSVNSPTSPGGNYQRMEIVGYEHVNTTNYNAATLIATQHLTTNVKIDCQTPGADIRYTSNVKSTPVESGPFNMGNHTKPEVTMPGTGTTSYLAEFSLGEDNFNGNLFTICAQVYINNVAQPVYAYEKAARSVIIFNNITEAQFWNSPSGNNLARQVGTGNQLQLWIRGGDSSSGENLTPGFPLSWNDKDYSGIRLMTRTGAETTGSNIGGTGTWYWVSWEVNTPAYFHFIAGVTPNDAGAGTGIGSLDDIRNNGPIRWSWAKNNWALQYSEYLLYPGGSLLFTRNTIVSNPATDNFEFYNSFAGSR